MAGQLQLVTIVDCGHSHITVCVHTATGYIITGLRMTLAWADISELLLKVCMMKREVKCMLPLSSRDDT